MPDLWEEAAKEYKANPSATPAPSQGDDWKVWQQGNEKPEAASDSWSSLHNFITSPNGLIRGGAREIGSGIKHLISAPNWDARAGAAAEMGRGGMSMIAPVGIGASIPVLVAAPIPALAAGATGYAGSKLLGAGTRAGAKALGGGEGVQDLAELGGNVGGGLIGGTLGYKGASKLGRSAAEGMANSALGTTKKNRAFGMNPGRAALEETSGNSPEELSESAGNRIGQLVPIKEAHIAQAPPVSLKGARDVLGSAADTRNLSAYKQLIPMQEALAGNRVTGEAYPETVPAKEGLDILRDFGDEFTRFVPEYTGQTNAAAKGAWGKLRNDIRAAAPETEAIDSRIANLIPARDLANKQALGPGMVETGVNRMTRPTGGLFPTLFGLAHGGPVGGAGVMAAQEALTQPSVKMAIARGLWRGVGGERPGLPQGPVVTPPRALIGPGTIKAGPVADTSGPVPLGADLGGLGQGRGERMLPPPSRVQQGGFATGTTNDLVPIKHPVTGQIEYIPSWMMQKNIKVEK